MRLTSSPVVPFLAVGALVLAIVVIGTGEMSTRAAETQAVGEAIRVTDVLAQSVAEPALPRGLVNGDPAAIDRFDRRALDRLLVGDVKRVKIWNQTGTVLYSDETNLIGQHFELGAEQRAIFDAGTTEASLSALDRPENRYERSEGGLLEVYTRIDSPEGQPLLFEVYYAEGDLAARQREIRQNFRGITVTGLLVLAVVATLLLAGLSRRLRSAAAERERLLTTAVDASDAERRRIARDLHDSVVQDLAGTTFAVSAIARAEDDPRQRAALENAAGSLRDSLRGLRSLLVEIHPPGLRADGLASALDDLTAPVAAGGVEVSVHVDDLGDTSQELVALLWRVAQEAVRNAVRHARAAHLSVTVRWEGPLLVLEVVDDGVGFHPGDGADPSSFGLRGLESLLADHGGNLEVRSMPDQGTTVRAEVGAR
jgi:signal transduction histidine kinase